MGGRFEVFYGRGKFNIEFSCWSKLFKPAEILRRPQYLSSTVNSIVHLMTSKLNLVLIILLSLQTKIILMKPSSFLRSPSYVDFFGGRVRDNSFSHSEDALEKKANSLELEGLKLTLKVGSKL